jgi:hypothetical protein
VELVDVVVEGTKLVVIVLTAVIVATTTLPLTVSVVQTDSTMVVKPVAFLLKEVTVLPLGRLFDDEAGRRLSGGTGNGRTRVSSILLETVLTY